MIMNDEKLKDSAKEVRQKVSVFFISFCSLFFISFTLQAATSFDSLSFKPATDQGHYLTVEQSQTLGPWGSAIGVTGDYSSKSLVLKNAAGATTQDVIRKQLALNLGMALGFSEWFNLGVNVSGVPYQQFVTPVTQAQTRNEDFGDVLLNLKVRLANNESSPVGLALVPFITFPSGNDQHFLGNGKVTGGGKVVLDTTRIMDRVSFAVNAGGQMRKSVVLSPGAQTIDDQFLYGGAMNVAIAKPVELITELHGWTLFDNFFKSNNRNLEVDGALRFLPGEKQRVQITAGGGAGLLKMAGVPNWRVFTTLTVRAPYEEKAAPPPPPPAPVQEEVITTNKIHFAFNKADIRPESHSVLEEILANIKDRSEIESVRIEGHTDNIGTDEYNQQLSEKRAQSVRAFFVNRGYAPEKIMAVGMGESAPIADNTTKDGRAKNRRVEFHLQISPGAPIKVEKKAEDSPTYQDGDRTRDK
ncbi:MAG: hypothetical protein A3I05_07130 [Deltaproteobacteria bacterium RIFCSPLOWO2_02_FULL_44_10]|nr:MAG: hypothetical protein A3C46_04110 [Deltaproteobacteria bacterium RIFCSPHIGHO2_02_FULL_44_16]OGQ46364.1 MAG: hypothetical protein A3I05_07130 [Deltaproteobacteria bacterium RIFCSPLOWO2_02_FULL_44_10]